MIRLLFILCFFYTFLLKAQQFQSNSFLHTAIDYNRGGEFLPKGSTMARNPHSFVSLVSSNNRQYKDTVIKKKHSPKLASIYSAVLPSLGQAYNKKYWKMPVVWAGLGVSGYFIYWNRKEMLDRQEVLIKRLDNDTNTNANGKYAIMPIDVLRTERNQYRTYRDYSIIAFAAIYLLNIVDASVDAHFYKFNIDKPLALQKQRHWHFASSKVQGKPTLGLAYRW